MGPRAGLDMCGKSPPHHRDSVSGPSNPKRVTIPTELFRSTVDSCTEKQGFDVLLAVHLTIILVINQLGAQNLVL